MTLRVKRFSLPLLALLLAFAGCNAGAPGANGGAAPASGGNSGGGGSSSAGGGAAAISATDNPHDVMMKAVRAQLDARSFRTHVTTSLGDGPANNMVIEYVAPDRYRMVSEPQTGGAAGGKREFVIVGDAAYIKGPNGQWVKSPIGVADIVKQFRDPKVIEDMAKATDVKLVGPETLDGTPTLVYQYTQNSVMGMNMTSSVKTWLAVSDGLPRKTEAEGEYGGKKTKTLATMSDYNTDIKIEAPIK
jgi:hypothetical protein